MLCSGCDLQTVDGLLLLPKVPAEYVQLQEQLDMVLEEGATYAVAESGTNRQAVQLIDLDGDRVEEAVAFFKTEEGAYRVYVFRQALGGYIRVGMAEGFGTTLQSIYYPVCDPDGGLALAMCWGFDESGAHGMTVYGLRDSGLEVLLDLQYADVTMQDIDGDGVHELAFAVKDTLTGLFLTRGYSFRNGQYRMIFEVPMCLEVKNVISMRFGTLQDGSTALYADSAAVTGGYVTDVICYDGRTAVNCTIDQASGSGSATWRSIPVSCADMNGDGQLDVPVSHRFEREAGETEVRYRLDWRDFRRDGEETLVTGTLHVPSENWYFLWPESWKDDVTVEKYHTATSEQTMLCVEPAYGDPSVLVTVWDFNGDNREEDARFFRRMTVLTNNANGLYGYMLAEDTADSRFRIGDDDFRSLFHTIETDWRSEDY